MVASLNRTTVAREAGFEMVQYISGRLTLTGADTPQVKIGTLPAGAVILGLHTRVVVAVTGGTPVLQWGVASGGGTLNAVVAEAAGSELVQTSATVAQPLAADTDVWLGTSGGATAGDVIGTVMFVKPLA